MNATDDSRKAKVYGVNDGWLALSQKIRKTEHTLASLRKRKLKSALNTDAFRHLMNEERRLNTRLKQLRRQLQRNAPPDGSTLQVYYPSTQTPDTIPPPTANRHSRQYRNILRYFAAGCSIALLVLLIAWGYHTIGTHTRPEPDAIRAVHQLARQAAQPLATAPQQGTVQPQPQHIFQPSTSIVLQPAATPHPPGSYYLQSSPSLTPQQIDEILHSYQSPATGTGESWYRLGVQYGIDPAFALAFFVHESTAGTHANWIGHKPDGTTTHNIGNIICAGYETCYRSYRDYPSWQTGIEDWYRLIDSEYIQRRGLNTIADVIPIYAPPRATPDYIASLEYMVDAWRRKYRTLPEVDRTR
jgi:hypothetical protein